MWLQTSSSSPIWFYEWYPDGRLNVNYLGYSYLGWEKRWFYGDTPGWHVLQYYSGGWSNYIYIYVYGSVPGSLNVPEPSDWLNPGPYWLSSGIWGNNGITTSSGTRTTNHGYTWTTTTHREYGDGFRKQGKSNDNSLNHIHHNDEAGAP